ncbi:MAG: Mss4p nuclear export [Cirrosporium novae-zelandiae]|nr:MAG: Mss4p nuclear export [Cirrosporium novae-zelandiae]
MGKRKSRKDDNGDTNMDDSDSSDMETVNVDFEWFDPQPKVDFHGLKTLLRQLLDVDAQIFNLSALADIILSQPLLGSTVKVDGNETDPYAFLTVLNLHEHKDKEVVKDLLAYIHKKASKNTKLDPLFDLLSSREVPQIGLILTERLLNIPAQVVPPMYTMLQEEIGWALEEGEPYKFTHYLVLSKIYLEVESKLDQEDNRPSKKKKKAPGNNETFYFHPEDEILEQHSICYGSYEYSHSEADGASDSKRAFQELGIKPQGEMILIDAAKFEEATKALSQFVNAQS